MNLHWLIQSETDLPPTPDSALHPAELAHYTALHSEKRRHDWRLGRYTARTLLSDAFALPPEQFWIARAADGAPEVRDGDGPLPLSLSISHRDAVAFCAAVNRSGIALGVDIELIEPHGPDFVQDFFTPAERAAVAASDPALRDLHIAAIWSAKEAVLKALRLGLSVDARAVLCPIPPLTPHTVLAESALADWQPFPIYRDARLLPRALPPLTGWWCVAGNYVLTLVHEPF